MTLQSALPQPFGVFPVLKPFVHPGLVAELNQHLGMVTAQFSLQLLIGTQETGGEGLSGRSVYQLMLHSIKNPYMLEIGKQVWNVLIKYLNQPGD